MPSCSSTRVIAAEPMVHVVIGKSPSHLFQVTRNWKLVSFYTEDTPRIDALAAAAPTSCTQRWPDKSDALIPPSSLPARSRPRDDVGEHVPDRRRQALPAGLELRAPS